LIRAVLLPIVTFEEARLTPSFGYVFDRKWLEPHESIASILWKFVRMNALAGHVVAAHCAKTQIDPYEGGEATREAVDVRKLRHALRLPLKTIRGAIIPSFLARISSPHFRSCLKCLRHGYHSVLHQLKTIQQCPVHGGYLTVDCPHCKEPSSYRLNARLLDAPYRCSKCHGLYASGTPSLLSRRRPLAMRHVVAVTRLKLRYYSS
jgi:predicted RNA-binding Zn-ribbon protein involved in translation (DUF1610 family)